MSGISRPADANCESPGEASTVLAASENGFPTWADLDKELGAMEWQWPGWLPVGMITLLAGEPGIGKSALALALAASITRGDEWPDHTQGPGQGKVVWAETEEAQRPNLDRARAWQIPLRSMIVPSTRGLFADSHLDRKEAWSDLVLAAQLPSVALVVVDSLRGAHRGDENSSQVVELLTNLASLARDAKIAVLAIHHLRKKSIHDPNASITLDRIRGSSAIAATPRVIWAVDRPNPLAGDHLRLYQIKNNLARYPDELGFTITGKGVDYISVPEPLSRKTQLEKATELLLILLEGREVPSTEVWSSAEAAGLSKNTLQRAKKDLGAVSVRKGRKWWWRLPR